ncbi:MAG: hypothetical protein NTX79_04340 [Candidatus Micrarchaeota archaeon]|nr:hypothetical protein [Candidatus Micrarchaeota archaeon]
MDNKDVKAVAVRFAIILVIFFAVVLPVSIYGWKHWDISQVFVPVLLLIVLVNAVEHFTRGAYTMWMFAKMKGVGWYKVEPELELAPGEEITYPISAAYIRMSGFALGYSAMPRDIIITNKRVAVGFDILGIREVFGEMNLWQPSLKEIPNMKKENGEIPSLFGNSIVKEAMLSKDGKAALVTASQAKISILIEIFHPKAKEIVELLGK